MDDFGDSTSVELSFKYLIEWHLEFLSNYQILRLVWRCES